MDAAAKKPLRSPEAAAFSQWHSELFYYLVHPAHLAELLFSAGIIGRDTKEKMTLERITSDEDEEQAQALMDAVQNALLHAVDAKNTFRSFRSAWEEAGFDTYYVRKMEESIAGEYAIFIKTR